MRTTLIALLLALALTGCGFFDDSPEEPTEPAVAEETGEAAPAPEAEAAEAADDGVVRSTNEVRDIVPEGPLATVQLTNGSTMEILGLEKLGGYYLYITGDLNGRTSTVISYTRCQDLSKWETILFKDENNFIIVTKGEGKELVFMNARLFLGSDSNDVYAFYSYNDNYEKVPVEVKKSAVASIKFN